MNWSVEGGIIMVSDISGQSECYRTESANHVLGAAVCRQDEGLCIEFHQLFRFSPVAKSSFTAASF